MCSEDQLGLGQSKHVLLVSNVGYSIQTLCCAKPALLAVIATEVDCVAAEQIGGVAEDWRSPSKHLPILCNTSMGIYWCTGHNIGLKS